MTYFLISASDGDVYIEEVTARELEKQLNGGDFGDDPLFLRELPKNDNVNDSRDWPEGFHLLIKGDIVVPATVEVVTKFSVD